MSDARKRSGFRVTGRDVEIVRWLGRVRLATVEQVRVREGMGRTKAYERLKGLVEQGLVVHERRVPGHGVYVATRQGLRMAGLGLAPATVSLGSLEHDLAVTDVVAELEAETRKSIRLWTERELRAHCYENSDMTFRPKVVRRGMRDARHWPDLAVLTGDDARPSWAAIEVERTPKCAQRLRAILAAYDRHQYDAGLTRQLWGVLYVVPDLAAARRVESLAAAESLRADSLPVAFDVQRLDAAGSVYSALRALATGRREASSRAAAAQKERQRQVAAREAAERAAREAADQQRREAAQLALNEVEPPAGRRGLGRLLGGTVR